MTNKKGFFGGLNVDDADFAVPQNDYIGALNIRVSTGESGDRGIVSTVAGNTLKDKTLNNLPISLPSGINETIGAAVDHAGRRVVFCNWNSMGVHGIYCYDMDDDKVYKVLVDEAPYTDGNLLKFSRDKFIHSAVIIDNKFYWTNDHNQPRRINIEAGIKMHQPSYSTSVKPYSFGVKESVISIVRNPPAYPVSVRKIQDTFVNNFIADGAFQFAYRFVYRDNEESVFGPYSETMNFNGEGETENGIEVVMPLDQKIEQDVQRIEFAVKNLVGDTLFVIRSYERGVDDAVLDLHNSGTEAIKFTFVHNTRGLPVDSASMVKPFDNVPLKSKTLAIAKNRLFLGNNLYGYDSPKSTSLSVVPVQDASGSSQLIGQWWRFVWGINQTQAYFLEIRGIDKSGFYIGAATQPPLPATVGFNNLTYIGPAFQDILKYLGLTYQTIPNSSFTITGDVTEITSPPSVTVLNNKRVFKSDSTYRAAIVFFDAARRKCGAVPAAKDIITADRTFSNLAITESLRWTLDNRMASEIPDWAEYYSICLTKSLRTNMFMQLKADEVTYIKKDPLTGGYSTTPTYAANLFGIAVKISTLNALGFGYTYQEGDMIKLYREGKKAVVKIKDTWSEWVIADLVDFGNIGVWEMLYEIYSPELQGFSEVFYEQGNVYKVLDAGTPNRRYSAVAGELKGDVFIVSRKKGAVSYQAEVMSPRDTFWKLWYTNASRENIIVRGDSARAKTDIAYSNTIVVGTKVNGLSQFEVLNSTQLPSELGGLSKLILANRVQGDGSVMLGVGEVETVSIYIGESQLFDAAGGSFLAKSDNVIGQVNSLAGGYGTLHPESVFLAKRDVYFFDSSKSTWIRYNVNGLYPVSDFKMRKFFKRLGADIRNYFQDPTEYNSANQGYPLRVLGAEDPYTDEVLICFPKMRAQDCGVYLQDLPNVKAYYEPYDGQGGTLAFLPREDKFTTFYSFKPDWITPLSGRVVSFKGGLPYLHDGAVNEFYGTVYDSVIVMAHSEAGNAMKQYMSIGIEGDEPDYVHIRTERPYIQSTDIYKGEYDINEGVKYAAIMRDRLSPNASGSYDERQYTGDRMTGEIAKIQVVFSQPEFRKLLKFVNISFNQSRGHKV